MSPSIWVFFPNNSPLCPTQNMRCTRSRAVVVALCNSHPEKKLQWDPSALFRKTKRGETAVFFASLSFLSNGLEMYYYANVNFDTELKKRLFVLFSKKKKMVPYVVSIASLFCKWIVNYAFCKGGVGDKDNFAKPFRSFCVHGISIIVWGSGEVITLN